MPPSPARARGLSRHTGSRKLPGNSRDMKDTKLAPAPNKKNRLRAVIPIGRASALVILIVVVELYLPDIDLLHHHYSDRKFVNALHRKVIMKVERYRLSGFEHHRRHSYTSSCGSSELRDLALTGSRVSSSFILAASSCY